MGSFLARSVPEAVGRGKRGRSSLNAVVLPSAATRLWLFPGPGPPGPGKWSVFVKTRPVHPGYSNIIALFRSDMCRVVTLSLQHVLQILTGRHIFRSGCLCLDWSSLPGFALAFLWQKYGKAAQGFVYWITWVMAALPLGPTKNVYGLGFASTNVLSQP